MTDVKVDDVQYVPAEEKVGGPIKLVVLDRGFVYIGRYKVDGDDVIIHDARCLIRWGTTKHLGELKQGPLKNTKLGEPCRVETRIQLVNHTIEVSQDGWNTSN